MTVEMLEGLPVARRADRAWRTLKLLNLFLPEVAQETFALILRGRADALGGAMRRELRAWLEAIKHHLESEHQDTFGGSAVRSFGGSRGGREHGG